MKTKLTIFFALCTYVLSITPATAQQFLATDINANDGSTDGWNCSSTPNTCTGSCMEPAWEWQWNAHALGLNSPNTLVTNPSLDMKSARVRLVLGNKLLSNQLLRTKLRRSLWRGFVSSRPEHFLKPRHH